jgi:hypothetical protein
MGQLATLSTSRAGEWAIHQQEAEPRLVHVDWSRGSGSRQLLLPQSDLAAQTTPSATILDFLH